MLVLSSNINFTACWMENGTYKFYKIDRYLDIYSIHAEGEKDDTEGRHLPYHMCSKLMSLEQFEYTMSNCKANTATHYKFVRRNINVYLSPADEYRVLIKVIDDNRNKFYIPIINIPGYGSLVHPECQKAFIEAFGINNRKVIEFFGNYARNYID